MFALLAEIFEKKRKKKNTNVNLVFPTDWAFFGDRSFIQNIMIEDYYNKTRAQIHENLRCTFVVVPSNLFAVYRAFGFPLGSKLVPRINK